MAKYLARTVGKKLVGVLLSVILLSVLVFALSRLTPTDPLKSYYGERVEKMSAAEKEAAREALGLNDGLPTQYVRWLKNAVRGDLGISYKYKQPVWDVISQRIGNTLLLGGLSFLLTFLGAIGLALVCARHEDRLIDRVLCKFGTLTGCVPEFWLSILLILIFSVTLNWLPSGDAYCVGEANDLLDRARHLLLPLTATVLGHLWYYAYLLRNRLLAEVREDYVLQARAKGLSSKRILRKHCLRNAMPSFISLMALAVPHILGGTYIVEAVFSYSGIGALCYESAGDGDYNLLMVLALLIGTTVMLCSAIGRVVTAAIDPRMRGDAE